MPVPLPTPPSLVANPSPKPPQFDIRGEPYGPAEQLYLTQKALRLSPKRWERLTEQRQAELLAKELWLPEKFDAYYQQETGRERDTSGKKKKK